MTPQLTRVERIALAVGVLIVLALMWPIRDYLTDDTFIHLQYARHLSNGHGLVFNPGERVYGCTSPLWVALLADAMALGLDGLWMAKLFGMLAAVGSVGLFLQLMRRTVETPEIRALATIAWSSHAWMARWATSGMETPLAVALILGGFVAFTEGKRWGARPVRTGSLWALAALTRPEAMWLLLLWVMFLLIETEDRFGLRRLISGTLPPLLIVGTWLLFARIYFGTFWPQTLAAKSAGVATVSSHVDSIGQQILVIGATDGVLLALLFVSLLLGRVVRISPANLAQRWLPWAWVFGLPALYLARGVPVISRYLLIVLPILDWLAWRAADQWWVGTQPSPARRNRAIGLAAIVMLLVIAQNGFVYQRSVIPHVKSFTPALESSLIRWGRWFKSHTPEGSVIAAPDIGAIGYFSERPVVDLAGLVTPRMVPHLVRQTPEEAVSSFAFASFARPDYLVDRAPTANALKRASRYGSALTPIGTARMPNLGVARPLPVVYTFYQVDWAVFDSLRATAR
ncbi:MAG TPA: hypothetical protein VFQ05_00120 [Candidatus Eisenbacteria bacterium]|nr:hypothetical protein [Candidatus Eisenbacteria bacterium]